MRFLIDEAKDDKGDRKQTIVFQFISWFVVYAAYQLTILVVYEM